MNINLSILFTLTFFTTASSSTITVNTSVGAIKGQTITVNQQPVHVFKSIKYARPPLGELRFKKPQPYQWSGTFDATNDGSLCWQPNNMLQPAEIPDSHMNEDCLIMNIWTSADLNQTSSVNSSGLMPVFVWIHGGAYHIGGINSVYKMWTDGSYLATHGVVVVAFNFRLHNLGLLFLDSEEAPGNVQFHDQLMAMKWVKNNIKAFGGDPNQVTLVGESTGSNSVGFHLVSPLAKGLFRRAIMQSGSPYVYGEHRENREEQLKKGERLIDLMGCGEDAENSNYFVGKKNFSSKIECLRKIDPKKLIEAINDPRPMIGGDDFIPVPVRKAIKSGRINPVKEILAGLNDDEGSLLTNKILQSKSFIGKDRDSIKMYLILIKFFFPTTVVDTDKLFNKLFDKYFDKMTNKDWDNQDLVKQKLANIVSDHRFNCPELAQMIDFARQPNNSVYFYLLTHKSKLFASSVACNQPWQGACHAQDIPFHFGSPLFLPGNWDQDDLTTARLFVYYFVNFVKTGNPLSASPPEELKVKLKGLEKWPNVSWPKFYKPTIGQPQRLKVMKLNPKQVELVEDHWRETCEEFWNYYFLD